MQFVTYRGAVSPPEATNDLCHHVAKEMDADHLRQQVLGGLEACCPRSCPYCADVRLQPLFLEQPWRTPWVRSASKYKYTCTYFFCLAIVETLIRRSQGRTAGNTGNLFHISTITGQALGSTIAWWANRPRGSVPIWSRAWWAITRPRGPASMRSRVRWASTRLRNPVSISGAAFAICAYNGRRHWSASAQTSCTSSGTGLSSRRLHEDECVELGANSCKEPWPLAMLRLLNLILQQRGLIKLLKGCATQAFESMSAPWGTSQPDQNINSCLWHLCCNWDLWILIVERWRNVGNLNPEPFPLLLI